MNKINRLWTRRAIISIGLVFVIARLAVAGGELGGDEPPVEEGYLDIPQLSLLDLRPPEQWKAWYTREARVSPTAVILPVVSADGVGFENKLGMPTQARFAESRKEEFTLVTAAKAFAELGMDIYLSVVPSMSFAPTAAMRMTDSSDDRINQACINRRATDKVLRLLTEEAIQQVNDAIKAANKEVSLAGVVLDITNLWPMSAQDGRLELTCYCNECKKEMENHGFEYDVFRKHPNPWNLLLDDSGTGIRFVDDIDLKLDDERLADEIAFLAKMKNFHPNAKEKKSWTPDELREFSQDLVIYLRSREELSLSAIRRFFKHAKKAAPESKRVIITDESMYNWTSGVSLKALDDTEICDEVWIDPPSWEPNIEKVVVRAYMWRRSRYFINSFFDYAASVLNQRLRTVTGIARLGPLERQIMLRLRAEQMKAGALQSYLELALLPELFEKRVVKVGVDEHMMDELLRVISRRLEAEEAKIPVERTPG